MRQKTPKVFFLKALQCFFPSYSHMYLSGPKQVQYRELMKLVIRKHYKSPNLNLAVTGTLRLYINQLL